MIEPKNWGRPPRRFKFGKVLVWTVLIIIIFGILGGGVFVLIKYFPSNDFQITIAKVKIEDRGSYLLYQPGNWAEKSVKRLVLVVDAGGEKSEAENMISRWSKTADRHGLKLAAVPNWDHDKLRAFLRQARGQERVTKVYISGFSNGGYNSCDAGLAEAESVNGIIPMGAYCDIRHSDVSFSPAAKNIPILTVIGSQDNWALGDDGTFPYEAAIGLNVEIKIVPGIGHSFSVNYMDEVGEWIVTH